MASYKSENTTKFLRLILLSFDTSLEVTKAFTQVKILPKYNGSFDNFLEANKHAIYHLWTNKTKCCVGNCKNFMDKNDNRLNKKQFQKVFRLPENPVPGHRKSKDQYCACGLMAYPSSLEKVDVSLLCTLIRNLGKLDPKLMPWVDTIRDVCNNLAHAESVSVFDQRRLQKWWDILEASILGLAAEIPPATFYKESVERNIRLLRMSCFDVDFARSILEQLKKENTQLHDMVIEQHVQTRNLILTSQTEHTESLRRTIEDVKDEMIKLHDDNKDTNTVSFFNDSTLSQKDIEHNEIAVNPDTDDNSRSGVDFLENSAIGNLKSKKVDIVTVCDVCEQKDQKYVAVEWCTECQKALCSTCSQNHNLDKYSQDHDTLSYNDYLKLPPIINNLTQTCPDHQEKNIYLCKKHDQLICDKCLMAKHKKCKETPMIKDIVRNIKTSHAFDDVACELEETSKILQYVIKETQNNLNEIQKQRKEMTRHVENTKERIMKKVNKLKQNMLSDIDATVNKTGKRLIVIIEVLQALEKEIRETIEQKQAISLHATDLQTYYGIKQMEKVVQETRRSLTEMSHDEAFDNIIFVIDQTSRVEMLLNKAKLFGEINVTKLAKDMSLEISKPQKAQKPQIAQNNTQNLPQQINLKQTFDLGYGTYWGCCILPTKMMVVTSSNDKQLKRINPDGTVKTMVKFEDEPYDVTVVDEKHVAVSHGKSISLVDADKENVITSWYTKCKVMGISYKDGHIIFCARCTGIKRLNIDAGTIDILINDKDVGDGSHVTTGGDRVCYTCPDKYTVTALNLQHDVIFEYKDEDRLWYPVGVTVDSSNCVYVTGYTSNNVLVISSDGQMVHQLLSEDDGLFNPTGIHYNGQQLAVNTKSLASTLCKYSLS